MNEAELVAGLKVGQENAWNAAHKRFGRDLYACAAHLLGVGQDAENAVQEAWLVAHLKMASFEPRGDGSLYAWLRQICVYKAFDQMRSRHRELASETEALEALSQKAAFRAQAHTEALQAKQALVQVVRQVLAALAEPCARLLDLREMQGQSYVALSKAFGWPLGTVMSRLSRCRRLLRQGVESLLGEAS